MLNIANISCYFIYNLLELSKLVSNSSLAMKAPREYSFSQTAEVSITNCTSLVGDITVCIESINMQSMILVSFNHVSILYM